MSELRTTHTFCRICESLCGLEVDIDGDEQTISRDELRAAVNLWRRLIAETTPSQSDQLKMHGRMGFCCEVM